MRESKLKMGDPGDLLPTRELELPRRDSEVIEEPDATTQEDRNEMNADFVRQARPDELLGDVRACYTNVLVASGGPR